jgi:hypothetical protein
MASVCAGDDAAAVKHTCMHPVWAWIPNARFNEHGSSSVVVLAQRGYGKE